MVTRVYIYGNAKSLSKNEISVVIFSKGITIEKINGKKVNLRGKSNYDRIINLPQGNYNFLLGIHSPSPHKDIRGNTRYYYASDIEFGPFELEGGIYYKVDAYLKRYSGDTVLLEDDVIYELYYYNGELNNLNITEGKIVE
jgi:hypothetical protein